LIDVLQKGIQESILYNGYIEGELEILAFGDGMIFEKFLNSPVVE
jgi:hypothetical protein